MFVKGLMLALMLLNAFSSWWNNIDFRLSSFKLVNSTENNESLSIPEATYCRYVAGNCLMGMNLGTNFFPNSFTEDRYSIFHRNLLVVLSVSGISSYGVPVF